MAERTSARSRVTFGGIFLIAAYTLVGCGAQPASSSAGSSTPKASATAAEKPAAPSLDDGLRGGTLVQQNEALIRDETERRAKSAPSGEPVGPKNTKVPRPEEYGFGKAVETAQSREVIAYTPRESGGRVVIPLTIENQGAQRTSYIVEVRVTGGHAAATLTRKVEAPNVFPHTVWPTEADITAIGGGDVESLKVTLTVTRRPLA
ncbi:hypothetical protein [Streptomyces sp. NPDC057375]|uniref:hypothetical protein n=1 Tax=Streptomyces sp. NPDC057375 TaxID=3346109 RepID=UPI00363DED61